MTARAPETTATTIADELRDLARRLMLAGIPPSAVGQEMIAAGAAMVAESLEPRVAARLLEAAAEPLRQWLA